MKKEIIVWTPRVTPTYYECEARSLVLSEFVSALGGRVWAGWVGCGVRVRIQGLSLRKVRVGLRIMQEATISARGSLVVVEQHADCSPLPAPGGAEVAWGTVLRSPRLTLRLLRALPSGAYLVSHRQFNNRSVLAVRLNKNREAVWRRAVAARAAGRVCYVAWTKAQHDEQRIA